MNPSRLTQSPLRLPTFLCGLFLATANPVKADSILVAWYQLGMFLVTALPSREVSQRPFRIFSQ